jgi:flagellar hook protein FlgE
MMRGMNAAISGLEASQTWLDTTANNLANANTIGYKAQSTTFQDELSQTLSGANAPGPGTGGTNAQQVGLGVQVGSIDNLMGQGSAQTTGNPLDVSIQGDGFFVVNNGPAAGQPDPANPTTGVQDPGSNDYTRAGNLTTNSNGVLTTQSGQYVMGFKADAAGNATTTPSYLVVPSGGTNVAIAKDGAVTYTDTTGATQTAGRRAPVLRRLAHRARTGWAPRSPASWRARTSTWPPSSPT